MLCSISQQHATGNSLGYDRFIDSFISYASEIKETADGSRRSASSEAERTQEV
jgi:hypothetical protein